MRSWSYLFYVLTSLLVLLLPHSSPAAPANILIPTIAQWTDRRPIAQFFISDPRYRSKENPGGYLDEKVNFLTAEGRSAFRQQLLQNADRWIQILKSENAQGMIVWDLEGYEQSSMVYVGDPRVLPWYSPAMYEVAEEFFKKFISAGLRAGVCIRPNKIFLIPADQVARWGKWGYLIYDEKIDDVVWEVSQRIQYAQKHWGCTIFYMDTNIYDTWVNGEKKSVIIPPSMLKELRRLHPDVLIIPELPIAGSHEYMAQYRELRGGYTGTPAADRVKYPGACSVLSLGGSMPGDVEAHWDTLAESVKLGDILFFEGWYPSEGNELVKLLYQQASYLKKTLTLPTKGQTKVEALLELTNATAPATRFLAIRALRTLANMKALPTLRRLLKDPDWLVRKEAAVTLGVFKDSTAVDALVDMLKGNQWGLRYFASTALQQIGKPALPAALVLAKNPDTMQCINGIMLLGGIDDPQTVVTLADLLSDSRWDVRQYAANALVLKKDKRAVPALIALLEKETAVQTIQSALKALGNTGDQAAKDALTKFTTYENQDSNWRNRIREAANTALAQLAKQ